MHRQFFFVGLFLSICSAAGQGIKDETPGRIDYQKQAENATWSWHSDQTSPLMAANPSRYDISLTIGHSQPGITISILRDGKTKYTWLGHRFSVFQILKGTLYFADFNPISSGGTIVAVNLESGKEIWRSPLAALGQVQHSGYMNQINIFANGEVVTVLGKESSGRYIEIKNAANGRTVGHRIFTKEPVQAR